VAASWVALGGVLAHVRPLVSTRYKGLWRIRPPNNQHTIMGLRRRIRVGQLAAATLMTRVAKPVN